ncbi:MAG TPA: amidohydrolase family protein [Tepidiformaceae bacterium]|nr:amidohydrolase family protein [Tepidiformaceae bacterium]
MPGFDVHTHLFAPGQVVGRDSIALGDRTFREMYGDPKAKMATLKQLLDALDEADLDGAVAAGFAFSTEDNLVEQNEYLAAAAKASEGRVIAFATVNPALPGWERVARHAIDRGARGFGELRPHNQGWDPLGEAAAALYGLAREAGMALLWHCSEPVGHTYPGKAGGISPAELIEVGTRFPGIVMIAGHLGAGAAYYLSMPEVRAAIESIYFDTAAASLLYDDQSVARLVELAGPDRVLFGSDYPLLSPRRQVQRLAAHLPGTVVDAVCGGNARRLFSDNGKR